MWGENQSSNQPNKIKPAGAACHHGLMFKARAGTVMAPVALAEHHWPWPAPPGASPCPALFSSDLLTFLGKRNCNLEERKRFSLCAGRRVPVVKELGSSPELVLCHPHHIASTPKDVPTRWWQLWALWGQEAPGLTGVYTKGLRPAECVLQWQEDLGGHQGQMGMKANMESKPLCCSCVPLWLHLLLTKALHFLLPFLLFLTCQGQGASLPSFSCNCGRNSTLDTLGLFLNIHSSPGLSFPRARDIQPWDALASPWAGKSQSRWS